MSRMKTEQKRVRRERIIWLLLFMAVFSAIFSIASEFQIDEEEAQMIQESVIEKMDQADSSTIFLNNILLGLVMFIPAIGVIFGMAVAFATGMAFSSFGISLEYPAFLILWLSPFGLMELVAYSIAMSRSLLIIKRRKFLRQDLKIITIELLIVITLLLVGGIIESSMLGL